MTALTLQAVPHTREEVIRFGGGDVGRAKSYLLALYGFLYGKPENTRKAYQRAIREFFELWSWKEPSKISVAEAAYYKKWLRAREMSDATICQRLAACQSFWDFMLQPASTSTGVPLVQINPFKMVTRRDCTPTPYGRSFATDWSDFEKVMDAIPDDITGKRDRALLMFFANTGRRRAEVAKLRVRDLNLTSTPKTYTVVMKGNKVQSFELSDACHRLIMDYWIGSNRLATLRPDSAVFGPTMHGPLAESRDPHRCLSVDQVHKILKTNVRRAGMDPSKFKLHALRHMFAHNLDEAGARLQDIQRAMGHSSVATTQIYTGKLQGPAAVGVQKQLDAIRAKAAKEAAAAVDIE